MLCPRLKHSRNQLAGEVYRNRKVLSKIEPRKKMNVLGMTGMSIKIKRGSHISQSLTGTARAAAFSSKMFHDKAHLTHFCRRQEKFTLKSHRFKLG